MIDTDTDDPGGILRFEEKYGKDLLKLNRVQAKPPEWIIPGFLVPGFNIIGGGAKTFKTFLVQHIIACMHDGLPVLGDKQAVYTSSASSDRSKAPRIVYVGAEHTASSIRYTYEKRVLKGASPHWADGEPDYTLLVADKPSRWRLAPPGQPAMGGGIDPVEFIKFWKPMLFILDPWRNFMPFGLDENDPASVQPLMELQEEVLSYGGAFVLVHHARKRAQAKDSKPDASASLADKFAELRGTGALFGMANGAIYVERKGRGRVELSMIFKEFPERVETWEAEKGHDAEQAKQPEAKPAAPVGSAKPAGQAAPSIPARPRGGAGRKA